jgi:hypothetical protein
MGLLALMAAFGVSSCTPVFPRPSAVAQAMADRCGLSFDLCWLLELLESVHQATAKAFAFDFHATLFAPAEVWMGGFAGSLLAALVSASAFPPAHDETL